MKKIAFILPLTIFFACQENTSTDDETISTESKTEEVVTETKPNIPKSEWIADSNVEIEVSGMMCEIGCVGTIRSHLSKMKGVTKVEMNFDGERETDFATVSFDSRMATTNEFVEEIESIADGIYSVISTKDVPLEENVTD